MTIAINIENKDSREKAIVLLSKLHKVDKSMLPLVKTVRELAGGESTTEYVHSGQSLIVEEIENG